MKIEKAIFVNRAPFKKVEFDFLESGVNVLSGINGRGKTTVISHIVDVFYEMARSSFSNTFEGKENKLYHYSSDLYNYADSSYSLFYARFKNEDKLVRTSSFTRLTSWTRRLWIRSSMRISLMQ